MLLSAFAKIQSFEFAKTSSVPRPGKPELSTPRPDAYLCSVSVIPLILEGLVPPRAKRAVFFSGSLITASLFSSIILNQLFESEPILFAFLKLLPGFISISKRW